MEIPIPKRIQLLKVVWDIWDIRVCIALSLFLQIFLGFFASWRQRRCSALLMTLIWSSYLLADWIAAFAIGQITKGRYAFDPHLPKTNEDLCAFWASFLLIHLGGPDSITSFAVEDNELWLRHLLGLFLQVVAVAYTLFLTLPDNNLWLPSILLFTVGTIKFGERTYALYRGSLDRFGASALPEPYPSSDYEEAMSAYSLSRWVSVSSTQDDILMNTQKKKKKNGIEVTVDGTPAALDDLKLLFVAYSLSENFKRLIVGFLLSSKHRQSSRNFFLRIAANEAFRIVEYELSFMYQVLHTKVLFMRCRIGFILRNVCFCFGMVSLVMFSIIDKNGFDHFDTFLTYVLLVGGLGLDMLSFMKLMFSDWTLVVLKDSWTRRFIASITLATLKEKRWSRSISQYNMFGYFFDGSPRWLRTLAGFLYLSEFLEKIKVIMFSTSVPVSEGLECFIFNELMRKSLDANNIRDGREACSQKGGWALSQSTAEVNSLLKWSIDEFQYAESLLLWHIATQVCCDDKMEEKTKLVVGSLEYSTTTTNNSNEKDDESPKFCLLLSNYMFYLLVAQNTLLAPVLGNWLVVFQDTWAEAKTFFQTNSVSDYSEACEKINSVKTMTIRPSSVKKTKRISKSVFMDAIVLAQQLRGLNKLERWRIMDQVWVEILSYAAINCRPIVHAEQPSKGGQLLTFTWLLMNHLGLGSQFYEEE